MIHSNTELPSTVILTDYTSPYQIELFDKVEQIAPGRLEVYYLKSASPDRQWKSTELNHRGHLIDRDPDALNKALQSFRHAELAVFNFYDNPVAQRLINLRSETGLPWAFWGERPGFYSKTLGKIKRLWKLRELHKQSAAIWGIGSMATDSYMSEYGPHRSYWNIPYFSDLSRFIDVPLKKASTRAKPLTILYSGSLIARKGVDLVAVAFSRLASSEPTSRLRVMGSGPLEKLMRKRLRSCQERVDFIGFRDWTELPSEYAKADILCVPSRYDGWGLVVPEGLAAGIPVISTTQTGSAVEFIKNGENGWLVPPGSSDAIFSSMVEATSMPPSDLERMSACARATIEGHTLEYGAKRLIAAARDAIASW